MAAGVRGRLVSSTFLDTLLEALPHAAPAPAPFARGLDRWSHRVQQALGPASSTRTIADVAVVPLLRLLGLDVAGREDGEDRSTLAATAGGRTVPILVVGWGTPLQAAWRASVMNGVGADARWAVACNGQALRVFDARRTWSRHYLEFALDALGDAPGAQDALWTLLRGEALALTPPLLDVAVDLSAKQATTVCRALGDGVLDAVTHLLAALRTHPGRPPVDAFEQSLTVLYRVLFLLFAEARGLVPLWHPVYRERYTIAAIVSTLLAGRRYRGVWQAVHAISRLAHQGCAVGELKVTAFNGRLFAPGRAAAFERSRPDDDVMAAAVLAVSTLRQGGTRTRIAYRDLDVEQLGAVYEHVLEYQPPPSAPTLLARSRDTRKSTGTFYTPRAVTEHLVSRTLAPLANGRSSAELLALRIVDPAMGSGAFLVAACRYLAGAVEAARIAEGAWHAGEVTAADRAALRREIALRCLYGVDLNPMAVQLARLSIWLATLAADKPLTFLDHHLVAGNSLVGATPDDLRRQPSRGGSRRTRAAALPLLEDSDLAPALHQALTTHADITGRPDDSAAIVHEKEAAIALLQAADSPLRSWSRVLDLWCAGWFWDEGVPPDAATCAEVRAYLLGRHLSLPPRLAAAVAADADAVAARHRFLHWPLAFPEVFAAADGTPLPNPGFDAVLGNPPWDMVRGDSGLEGVRDGRRNDARRMTDFVRESGIYHVDAGAHVNRYQLFLERALQLARRGGRIGLVLPSGLVADAGAAALRRHLFNRSDVDSIIGLDNRHRIFPIHRSVRFVLLTCTPGAATTQTACRFGLTQPDDLEPAAEREARAPLVLTRRLLARLSGEDDLGIPELLTARDLAIVERIASSVPALRSANGWHVAFGRELNATDDRGAFVPYAGEPALRPVLEGKQVEPFRSLVDGARQALPAGSPLSARVPRRARLAYRDVASATNRLTLIAAVIPARCVTTHTVFCLKTLIAADAQHVLCALLNSFVANYLIRLRVNTHVTASLMSRLPVPLVSPGQAEFDRLLGLSRALATASTPIEETPEYAELQALAGRLYRLSVAEFEHVLGTFPLVGSGAKGKAVALFNDSQ